MPIDACSFLFALPESLFLSRLNGYNHDNDDNDNDTGNNNDYDYEDLSKLRHEAKLHVEVCFNAGNHRDSNS